MINEVKPREPLRIMLNIGKYSFYRSVREMVMMVIHQNSTHIVGT